MNKGRWALVIVALVALGMGISTWPLLRIRRKNEVHRTEALLKSLRSACDRYRQDYDIFPPRLAALKLTLEPRDAWGRPIQYEVLRGDGNASGPRPGISIWSLGPNPDDASDDILPPGRAVP